ncbi:hypothetical protein ACUH7Y_17200 [Clostridium beijerinckii]|uniref:Uncharacterized protein n=1 Tax=Clostridium beijerinckii TaxID=1520 RepID=A0A1S8SDB4_CLOBE|nr:hypothetical protein [Clostridium beijerinckii]NMF07288.1 hypothetical protein [Clostridium beijerinckii]NRY59047.1 hypothetical protein [Clostridium beijerinckii]OOM63600.1 hypothetical protein CLBCK_08890 [Clostridium beijerinckii]
MKKNFLTKLAAVALVMGAVVTALPASADTTYMSKVFSGTNDNNRSERKVIAAGEATFYGIAKAGTGDGYARKYVSSGTDKTVASVSVKNVSGKDTDNDDFTADGSSQYYMRWSGYSDGSQARLKIVGID